MPQETPELIQSPSMRISNMTVRVLHEYTGRGPTKARTTITGDLVVVVLQDTLLKAERTLVDAGDGEFVRELRRRFQSAMREDLVQGVEEVLERRVIAFMSDNHVDPDIAAEMFVLEPEAPAAA